MQNKLLEKSRNHLDFRLKKKSINIQTSSLKNITRNISFNNRNNMNNKAKKPPYMQLSLVNKNNFIHNKYKNLTTTKKSEIKSLPFKKRELISGRKLLDPNIKYKLNFNNTKLKFNNILISSKKTKLISDEGKEIEKNETDNKFDFQNIIFNKDDKSFSVIHFIKSNNLFIFIINSKTEDLFKYNHNLKQNEIYEIKDDFEFPSAYKPRMNKYEGMPQCLIDACDKGNISLIKNENNCNIIWKLLSPEKMRELIRKLNKHQKFNHFPCTYRIGLKDNMYIHFKQYKKIFPDLYDFVSDTYILPNDAERFEKIYKKNKNTLWIVKPVNMSRGRGVHLLKELDELKELIKKSRDENSIPDLISRYLDKPHLINKKKYDLRIYVLVASFSPLRIYLYYNGLVRFATEDYQQGNYDNIYIHITNYSINKNNSNYKSNQKNNNDIENNEDSADIEEDDSSKWSLVEYRNYFKKLGLNDTIDDIWKQIENIIIKSLITVTKENCQEISINKNNSLFELYGYDILIDETFKAWLIEVNVNPSLHCTSPIFFSKIK